MNASPTPRTRKRFLVLAGVLGLAVGLAAGVGGYTFVYAKGASYLSNNPETCANCHVMRDHFDAWTRSSHHAVAVCNDCHLPPGLAAKYLTKASNGWHHSLAFTTGRFHQPIMIKPGNHAVTEHACRKCHADVVHAIDRPAQHAAGGEEGALSCVRCHASVGHLR